MGAPSLPEFLIVISIIALYILPTYLVILINIKTGAGTTYSRKKYWIWSIVLLLALMLGTVIFKAIELFTQAELELDSTEASTLIALSVASGLAILLPAMLWLNALANRIRDYGGNPWMAMWTVIPLVNIIMGLYYGIVKHKSKKTAIENNEPSLAKAVYNHSKDIASEIKPAIHDYKYRHQGSVNDTVSAALDEDKDKNYSSKYDEHHTITTPGPLEQRRLIGGYNSEQHDYIVCKACKTLNVKENNICYKCKNTLFELPLEDSLYEQALVEVEENKQIKSLWAKALVQSDGDENRAKALYINSRFEQLFRESLIAQEQIQKEQIQKIAVGNLESVNSKKHNAWLDEKTGLMWEVIREESLKNRYTFPEAIAYVKNLNATSYAGFDDWRLPCASELGSLCKHFYGVFNPEWKKWIKDKQKYMVNGSLIIPSLITNLDGSNFWCSHKNELLQAYCFRFDEGNYKSLPEDHRLCVRCVRGKFEN